MRYLFIVGLVLLSLRLHAAGEPTFQSLCEASKRPAGFDALVAFNLKTKATFGNRKTCESLAKKAAELQEVYVTEVLDPPHTLEVFPRLTSVYLGYSNLSKAIAIGKHPKLKSFTLSGVPQLDSLGDLLHSPELNTLSIVSAQPDGAYVDLQDLARLPKMGNLMLGNLEIRHAKAMEALPALWSLFLKNVSSDHRFSAPFLKQLKSQKLENVTFRP